MKVREKLVKVGEMRERDIYRERDTPKLRETRAVRDKQRTV